MNTVTLDHEKKNRLKLDNDELVTVKNIISTAKPLLAKIHMALFQQLRIHTICPIAQGVSQTEELNRRGFQVAQGRFLLQKCQIFMSMQR